MKIRILLPGLLSLAAACGGGEAMEKNAAELSEALQLAAEQTSADPVETARRRVAEVDTMIARSPDRERMWAKVPERAELVAVNDTASWPEEVETSINTWTDPRGRPVALVESPFSQSGDWFAQATHWFDEQGRTVAFEMHVSAFAAMECTDVVRDTWRTLYDASFRALRTDSTHTDGDGKPIPADCQGPGDWTDLVRPAPTYEALVREGRAPPLPPR